MVTDKGIYTLSYPSTWVLRWSHTATTHNIKSFIATCSRSFTPHPTMTVEVMKDLPTLPNPDETKVDSDPRPTHSPAIRKPPLERGVHHPKHTTRLWDNWYTVQQVRCAFLSRRNPFLTSHFLEQGRSTTHLAHLVQIERPILSAPAGYTQEICPPPPVSPSSSATTPGSGKRSGWGLFGSKYAS
jgi:hypothetical protein